MQNSNLNRKNAVESIEYQPKIGKYDNYLCEKRDEGVEIMDKKYAYIYNLEDEKWHTGYCSLSDALYVARANNPDAQTVYIAETEDYVPPIWVDCVVDNLRKAADDVLAKSSEDFLCDLIDQEIEDLEDALTEAFEKWGRETGNPYWIEIPIKGTERLYDLQTGKPVEEESE